MSGWILLREVSSLCAVASKVVELPRTVVARSDDFPIAGAQNAVLRNTPGECLARHRRPYARLANLGMSRRPTRGIPWAARRGSRLQG